MDGTAIPLWEGMKNIAAVYPANCHPRGCGLASRVNRLESVRGFCEHIGGIT